MDRARRVDMLLARHLWGLDAQEREVICLQELGFNNSHVTAIYDPPGPVIRWDPRFHPLVKRLVVPGGPGDYVEVDRYSTTYAGMGMVIEQMRANWAKCQDGEELYWEIIDCGKSGWLARVKWPHHDGEVTLEEAAADTLPAAVAEAALVALGVDIGEDGDG